MKHTLLIAFITFLSLHMDSSCRVQIPLGAKKKDVEAAYDQDGYRLLKVKQFNELLNLYVFNKEPRQSLPGERRGQLGQEFHFLLFDDQKHLGTIKIFLWEKNNTTACDSYGYIYNFWIHREQRGKGYGRKLFDIACNSIEEAGYKKMTLLLWGGENNKAAYKLYKSAGFVRDESRKKDYYMVKDLGYTQLSNELNLEKK